MRITLIHHSALGDTLLLLPLIASLRRRFSTESPHITLVTHPNLGQMLTMLHFTDAYASADDPAHTRWFGEPDLTATKPQPDWATCDLLLSSVSTGTDQWATNARHFSTAKQILFFNPRPPTDYPRHVTDFHREQLSELHLHPAPLPPLRTNPDGPLIIHPGSGGEPKCWPRENFLSLARTLNRLHIRPILTLGEAEMERWGTKFVSNLKEEFGWYLHMGFYELADKLSRARLYLGNDSGVTHLAAALGIPTLALFGPSNDTHWHPIGPEVKLLRAHPPYEKEITQLKEDDVLNAILAEFRKIN